jgi:hypothetical protein
VWVPDVPIFECGAAQRTRKLVKYGAKLAFSGQNVSDLNSFKYKTKKMDTRIKAGLGVLAGILAGGLSVFLGEMILHKLYAPPININLNDADQVRLYLGSIPTMQWVMLVFVYFFAALVAGYITNLVCKGTKYRPALVSGIGLLITTLLNFNTLGGHPIWVWIASTVAILAGAWTGGRLIRQENSGRSQ